MYITILPHETIMLSVDGLHVVLMEQDQRMLLQWLMSNLKPPAPASPAGCNIQFIRPTPDCFGKWQGLDSEKCKACSTWGYCADLEARTATIRNQTRQEIIDFIDCWSQHEAFLCVDQDHPVVLLPEILAMLESLRTLEHQR